jgi:hypothetical protein
VPAPAGAASAVDGAAATEPPEPPAPGAPPPTAAVVGSAACAPPPWSGASPPCSPNPQSSPDPELPNTCQTGVLSGCSAPAPGAVGTSPRMEKSSRLNPAWGRAVSGEFPPFSAGPSAANAGADHQAARPNSVPNSEIPRKLSVSLVCVRASNSRNRGRARSDLRRAESARRAAACCGLRQPMNLASRAQALVADQFLRENGRAGAGALSGFMASGFIRACRGGSAARRQTPSAGCGRASCPPRHLCLPCPASCGTSVAPCWGGETSRRGANIRRRFARMSNTVNRA